jgi:hypothetical protein
MTNKLRCALPPSAQKLRIFIDGRLVAEYPLFGNSRTIETSIALLPASRWIAAVAVDTAGYESVPQGRELTGARAVTTSRLFAITAGTDRYNDLPRLFAAASDARRFGEALTSLCEQIDRAVV